MLYDLSPTVRPDTAVWPGDTPFSYRWSAALAQGDPVNLSTVTTTPHVGSHADAPLHTEPRGEGIGDLGLAPFLGPCRVVRVPPTALIEPRHLEGVELAPPGGPGRLLLRTDSVRDRAVFPERFAAISPELARKLAEAGLLLVGVDTPSVDSYGSDDLAAHHALARGGVVILEGLVLDGVAEGVYELIALPLKLAGLDASPVRAVLRSLPG